MVLYPFQPLSATTHSLKKLNNARTIPTPKTPL